MQNSLQCREYTPCSRLEPNLYRIIVYNKNSNSLQFENSSWEKEHKKEIFLVKIYFGKYETNLSELFQNIFFLQWIMFPTPLIPICFDVSPRPPPFFYWEAFSCLGCWVVGRRTPWEKFLSFCAWLLQKMPVCTFSHENTENLNNSPHPTFFQEYIYCFILH